MFRSGVRSVSHRKKECNDLNVRAIQRGTPGQNRYPVQPALHHIPQKIAASPSDAGKVSRQGQETHPPRSPSHQAIVSIKTYMPVRSRVRLKRLVLAPGDVDGGSARQMRVLLPDGNAAGPRRSCLTRSGARAVSSPTGRSAPSPHARPRSPSRRPRQRAATPRRHRPRPRRSPPGRAG